MCDYYVLKDSDDVWLLCVEREMICVIYISGERKIIGDRYW